MIGLVWLLFVVVFLTPFASSFALYSWVRDPALSLLFAIAGGLGWILLVVTLERGRNPFGFPEVPRLRRIAGVGLLGTALLAVAGGFTELSVWAGAARFPGMLLGLAAATQVLLAFHTTRAEAAQPD